MSIPADWNFGKLGEVCSIAYGKGLPVKSFKSDGFPVFGANGIIGFSDTYHHENEQVLISCRGAASGTINMSPKKCFVTNNSLVLKINNKNLLLKKFLFFALHVAEKSKLVSGTAQPQVTINNANELLIPIPPLPEQHLIVSKIEELFSELDNGIAQLKTAQQQLKVYRQSLLKAAFEGRLTAAWRQNNQVGNKENISMSAEQEMGYGDKGKLPEGWKWVKLAKLLRGTPQNGLYKSANFYGNGVHILRIDGFYDGVVLDDYSFKRVMLTMSEVAKYQLAENDIVINRVNSMSHLGKCGLIRILKEPTVFESNVMRIKLETKLIVPAFLVSYLSSNKGRNKLIKNAKHAVNQASINQNDVVNSELPLPPIQEQHQIVFELESRLTVCDKMEVTISQNLQQSEAMRQSILKKAFEGRLV